VGYAQEKISFSLKEVQDYAVKNSTKTKNARTDIAIARKKIWETTALGLPQINASVSYQDMMKIPTTLIPARIFDPDEPAGKFIEMQFGTQHNATFDVTATQLIFQGSYIVALQASKIFLRISQEGLIKSEIEVKEAVTNSYYLILLAQNTLNTLELNLKNLKQNFFEVKEMHKAGFMEDTDVDQMQLAITDLKNSIKSLERQLSISFRLLKFQMGLDLDTEIKLSENLRAILSGINPPELLEASINFQKHIDYRIMNTQEKAMVLTLKREKSEYLPSVAAFFTHSENAMRDEFNFLNFNDKKWFPTSILGVQIKIPIFSSGMKSARVKQAKLELKKAQQTKSEVLRGLQLGLQLARIEFINAMEKTENTKKSVQLAEKIYSKTLIKYKQGISSSLELSQTHTQYLGTQSNYTRATIDLLTAKTTLDKALNRL